VPGRAGGRQSDVKETGRAAPAARPAFPGAGSQRPGQPVCGSPE
jgi:hypothetical protein